MDVLYLLLILCILAILFAGYQIFVHRALVTEEVRIIVRSSDGQSLPCDMVVLSDLHNRQFGKSNERLLRAIDDCRPSAVLIPGDLVTKTDRRNAAAEQLLMQLYAREIPVYYALGNHEQSMRSKHSEQWAAFLSEIDDERLHLLDNASAVTKDGVGIIGWTLPDGCYGRRGRRITPDESSIRKVVAETADQAYRILLVHTPYYFSMYQSLGADLVVSGHLHGGIVRLPLIGGVISPQMELFPKYDAGVFCEGDTTMVVSRGLGSHTMPIRIGNRPQLITIRFVQEGQE
ncbi:MAG: metallophosphoesterase [Lachnospiraceae bacterium]|nr:metallophosphoesterase [Lachnospiraceae bacterium]